jgi:adenine phosphoribosyltransferase
MKIACYNMLNLAKHLYDYRTLSKMLGLPEPVICRYKIGRVTPSVERAKQIIATLAPTLLTNYFTYVRINRTGNIDIDPLIENPHFLSVASYDIMINIAGKRMTKILTTPDRSMTLATAIALLTHRPLVIATETITVGNKYSISHSLKRKKIRYGDSVLIITDIVRTGATLRSLINIVHSNEAEVLMVHAIACLRETLERLKNEGIPIKPIYIIENI